MTLRLLVTLALSAAYSPSPLFRRWVRIRNLPVAVVPEKDECSGAILHLIAAIRVLSCTRLEPESGTGVIKADPEPVRSPTISARNTPINRSRDANYRDNH